MARKHFKVMCGDIVLRNFGGNNRDVRYEYNNLLAVKDNYDLAIVKRGWSGRVSEVTFARNGGLTIEGYIIRKRPMKDLLELQNILIEFVASPYCKSSSNGSKFIRSHVLSFSHTNLSVNKYLRKYLDLSNKQIEELKKAIN